MHWADAFVQDLEGKQLFSTGISPSGHIHVGNMREILTGDMLFKAAVERGLDSRFIYLCDDIDPLRKVYPFLPQSYAEYVGMPLYKIPAPRGEGAYSEYFLGPFLETLDKINVKVEVIRTSDLYEKGVFAETIDKVITKRDQAARILEEVSGRALTDDWYPYNPLCSNCGKINKTRVLSYKFPEVEYMCECGHHGVSDVRRAQGKMPWRIEWPAKWHALGVTVEPFGKDHGVKGGSYDSGKRIQEEIFGTNAPKPLVYEHIFLKGKGAMHSSTGNVIEAAEMIRFSPPQTIRFLIARSQPSRHIDFDPSSGLLNLIDEYEKYELAYREKNGLDDDSRRVYELSRLEESTVNLTKIGFRHLVTLTQIYPKEEDLQAVLKRTYSDVPRITPVIRENIEAIREWLKKFAPESVKFTLLPMEQVVDLSSDGRGLVIRFLSEMDAIEWSPEVIHNSVHQMIKDSGLKPADGFAAFYRILVGKDRGPRLGYFLSTLGKNYTRERLAAATGSKS